MPASCSSRLVGLPMILCAIGLAPTLSPAQQVEVCVSSKAGDRLAFKEPLRFDEAGKDGAAFRIDPSSRHQKMDGFGASFLEAGMVCLNDLSKDQQEGVFRALFDPRLGAGFSAMKTVIAGTDFMSGGPWYTYDDVVGDVELKHFSIERDLGPTGLITYIRRAAKYGKFMLQAPMDYPPDWMLVDVNKNQDVSPDHHDTLARYYLRYLQEYQKQGIFIDYLSLFNEPGIYTKIKYDSIRHLIKEHVGPLFKEKGVKTQLQLSESSSRDGASGSIRPCWTTPMPANMSPASLTTGTTSSTSTRSCAAREVPRPAAVDDRNLLCLPGRDSQVDETAANGLRGRRFLGQPDHLRSGGRGVGVDLLEHDPRSGRPALPGLRDSPQPSEQCAAPGGHRRSQGKEGHLHGLVLLPRAFRPVRPSGIGADRDGRRRRASDAWRSRRTARATINGSSRS